MKPTADWLAWSLQFFAGFVGGAILGFVIVTRRSMGHWLAPDHVSTFLCGIAFLGAGLASYYGDRFWYGSSAYRVSSIEDIKHNAATRIGSIAAGILGTIIILTTIR
jgi:hypothetical protein